MDRANEQSPGQLQAWIGAMVDRIVRQFAPEAVILFGSHARGSADSGSDVDLLVVMDVPTTKRAARLAIYRALTDRPLPLDVVVATPEEVHRRGGIPGTILYPALREGHFLYRRSTFAT